MRGRTVGKGAKRSDTTARPRVAPLPTVRVGIRVGRRGDPMKEQHMQRREVLALVVGAVALSSSLCPLPARAQQGRVPRIGIIDNGPLWDHFRQGLREQGLIEGRNVALEYRTAESDPARLAAAANELVRLPVDLIAVYGTPASAAAKAATSTIPIVAISVGDPVRAGLVPSLARPGGNLTGNTILGPEVAAKRLQLMREAIP